MAIVQIFGNRQDWLPRSAPIRITVSIWSTVGLVLLADFCLIQITKSIALLFAFHLALLSIFLLINLILHPVNLFFSIRERSENQISRAITEALCLLLHSLSFILLVMLLIWESGQKLINEENIQLLSLQLSAYTIHSIANPLIALLRDPKLAHAIGRLVYTKDRNLSPLEYQTFLTQQIDSRHPTAFSHWIFAEPWIFRFERPPPAYSSRSGSLNIIYDEMVPPIEEPTNV
uniref:G_PROTEIN_RECEP_F1_2 domain-containing protein n=1 Tax=Rhabditophanes sp. KR3021 TaxID=114890 RepID=A0AC35TTZ2_9BILA